MGTPDRPHLSVLERSINDLLGSHVPEEKTLGQEAKEKIKNHALFLRSPPDAPLLTYLIEGGARQVIESTTGDRSTLYITGGGQWLVGAPDSDMADLKQAADGPFGFPLGQVIEGLLRLVREAENAKCKRLKSIDEARIALGEIGEDRVTE